MKRGRHLEAGRAAWRETWRGIALIVRREIVDTLRDWRIVAPITTLVLAFPFIAEFVAAEGLKFFNKYGAALIMERFFPFLILVVGFFPSTFSLVIALETFVGEKERRSLEPLLATPLTDGQLYVGKLIAATLPPVVASYVGMLFYILLLGLKLHWWPSLHLLAVAFVLATTQALVMVAVAVIISAQSTSVRAANLLASFIIIPMSLVLQWEAGLLLFADFTALWLIALFLFVATLLFVRIGLRMFDREYLLGRELDFLDFGAFGRAFLEGLRWPGSLRALYGEEIPALLRVLRAELTVTLVVIGGGLLIALWGFWRFPLPRTAVPLLSQPLTMEQITQGAVDIPLLPPLSPLTLFTRNAGAVLLGAFLSIFTLGIVFQLMVMGVTAVVGYALLLTLHWGMPAAVPAMLAPHGPFEMTAIIIATAQSLRLGLILLSPAHEGGGFLGLGRELGHFVKLFAALIAPLLLIAAIIEATITPRLAIWVINGYLFR